MGNYGEMLRLRSTRLGVFATQHAVILIRDRRMDYSIDPGYQYPIFGPEIQCPHCRQIIPALTLTDTYLCARHGAFEADPKTGELVHLQSGRHWRRWENEWYRQHTHPDGIRFEIHEALDRLYTQGYRATKVIIARRYQELMGAYSSS
jgi:uncharacterized protein (TIGR02652 family)